MSQTRRIRARIPSGRARRHGRAPWRTLVAVGLLVLLTGCISRGRTAQDDLFRPDPDGPVRIEVQNRHFNDARIYVLWSGSSRRRIGMVTGTTTQTLETEWRGDNLRIEVDLVGAGGFVTRPIGVWPGETVVLQIPPN